jgi:hypothetical protein
MTTWSEDELRASLARVPAKHDGTVAQLAQFHPSTRKNPLQSSARAIRCAKLCHRLTQCTGHKQFVFPQIFSSFPQNSTTERQPSQSGGCLHPRVKPSFVIVMS